jgi:excisionase family DNA binding protein
MIVTSPTESEKLRITLLTAKFDKTDHLIIKDTVHYLQITERTVDRLAAAKKIPAFKVGGSWLISRADIDSWIRAQTLSGTEECSEKGHWQGDTP